MQKRLVDAEARLIMIRNLLIFEYVGVATGDGGDLPGNEKFREKLLTTIREFKDKETDGVVIAHKPWEVLVALQMPGPVAEEIRRYTGTIKDLATEFGLRPKNLSDLWWGYECLHDVVTQTIRSGTNYFEKRWWAGKGWVEPPVTRIFTPRPWERDPWTVRKRIIEDFERDWEIGDQVLIDTGYVVAMERELFRHIHWLYLAICPNEQAGLPLTYQQIADTELSGERIFDLSTISKAVRPLANLLDIDLAKSRGRPRK